jgi:hypothetical protein
VRIRLQRIDKEKFRKQQDEIRTEDYKKQETPTIIVEDVGSMMVPEDDVPE